jgi:hypothetical protein
MILTLADSAIPVSPETASDSRRQHPHTLLGRAGVLQGSIDELGGHDPVQLAQMAWRERALTAQRSTTGDSLNRQRNFQVRWCPWSGNHICHTSRTPNRAALRLGRVSRLWSAHAGVDDGAGQ